MTHDVLLSPDLRHVRAERARHGFRRRRFLARLVAMVAPPAGVTAADIALTDDEMLAESAGWW